MQELIEKIELNDYWIPNHIKNELLEKEKEQMVDFAIGAYQDISKMKGVPENLISENKILFEEYYNEKFNQNK